MPPSSPTRTADTLAAPTVFTGHRRVALARTGRERSGKNDEEGEQQAARRVHWATDQERMCQEKSQTPPPCPQDVEVLDQERLAGVSFDFPANSSLEEFARQENELVRTFDVVAATGDSNENDDLDLGLIISSPDMNNKR